MAEEIYAKEAALRDDRVQEISFNATTGVTFVAKAYVESPYKAPQEAGVTIAGERFTLDVAKDMNYIDSIASEKSLANLEEFNCGDYGAREEQAKAVRLNAAFTDDVRAAAEIHEDLSKKRCEEKVEDRAVLNPKYYKTFIEIYKASFGIRLFREDETLDKKVQDELDRRITKVKALKQALETKFSKTFSYGDRLLKARAGADKEMGSPVQNTNKKYADL